MIDIDAIEREFIAKGAQLDGAWDWANDHGPDLIVEVKRLQFEMEQARDEFRSAIKCAYVAGAVAMAEHAGLPTDDLDEGGYDYASSVMK